ncbi:MAG: PQQ-binding-like beta-propeller repeat protein [Planctomycetes bacterium]|nr:PQQ-binding-like beta-propeller repeat protein [Planctomycetota bacterium]
MIAIVFTLLIGSAPRSGGIEYLEFSDAYTSRAGLAPLLARAGASDARDSTQAFRDDAACAAGARLLVVGSFATNDPAIRRAFVEPRGALWRFVEEGGVILIFSQADQDVRSEDWTDAGVIVTRTDRDYRSVTILRPDHPLLSGLTSERLGVWEDPSLSWETLDRAVGAEVLAAQDASGSEPWLAEAAWGKGRAIFCAWPIDKLPETAGDPERDLAATFLRNAIAYADLVARGDAPVPEPAAGPTISGTVFADRDGDGSRDPDEPGLAGVGVSDGFAVTVTDGEGRYRLDGIPENVPCVFATIPAGFRKTHRSYRHVEAGRSDGCDFGLSPLEESARETSIAHVADIHIGIEGVEKIRDAMIAGLEEISRLPDPPAVVVGAGDLTNATKPEEFRGLIDAMERARIPFMPVIGNHDCASGAGGRDAWRRAMGPDWWSFDVGDWHVLCVNSIVRSRAQETWLERDVERLGRGKRKIAFQHYPPTRPELERFARLGVEAVGSGHWHTTRILEDRGVLSINTATFLMGGIDLSPAGFRILRLDAPRIAMEYRFAGEGAMGAATPFPAPSPSPRVRLGDPWPQLLGGPARTGRSAEAIRPPLRLAWKRSIGAPVQFAQPVVADGKVFAVPNDFDGAAASGVVALDAGTGEVAWRFRTAGQTWNAAAYAEGLVVIVDQPGRVDAIDAATGRLVWTRELVAPGDADLRWFKSAPAIADGIVYAGNNARIAALRLAGGEILWQKRYAGDWICGYASPAVADGIVIAAGLWTRPPLGLDIRTGEIVWEAAGAGGRKFSIQAAPTIAGGRALFGRVDGRLSAHDIRDGKLVWDVPLPENWSPTPPVAFDGRVIAGSGTGIVSAHDAGTGEALWQYATGPSLLKIISYRLENPGVASAAVLAGEILYVGGADGKLRALELATGSEIWSHDFGVPVLAPPAPSGNALFVAAMDGYVYALVGEEEDR